MRTPVLVSLLLGSHLAAFALGGWARGAGEDTSVQPRIAVRTMADGDTVRAAALLGLEDPRTRREAAAVLGFVAAPADAELLWTLALDRDARVADTAVESLGRAGGPAAEHRLVQLAEDAGASTREAALRALGDLSGTAGMPTLEAAVLNPRLQGAASEGLARKGTPRAVATVTTAFWSAGDPGALAAGLAAFPEESGARTALWSAVRSGAPPTFSAALEALASVEDPALFDTLVPMLKSTSPSVRSLAVDALQTLDDPRAVPPLLAHLEVATGEEIRGVLIALVSLGGTEVDDRLLELAKTAPVEIAAPTADWLYDDFRLDDVDTMVELIHARPGPIADSVKFDLYAYDWTRGQVPEAVLAVAREDANATSERSVSDFLGVLLEGGKPADVALVQDRVFTGTRTQRQEALVAIAEDPGEEVDAILLALLEDSDPDIVRAAISALEDRGSRSEAALVDALVAQLGNQLAGTGWGDAEEVLARIGGERGTAALLLRVRDGTTSERDNAISALLRSETAENHAQLYAVLDTLPPRARAAVLTSSFSSGNAPRDRIVAHLTDADPAIAESAMIALAEAEGPAAEPALSAVLEDRDVSAQHREAALDALVTAGPISLETLLLEARDDEELAGAALDHLAELGTDAAGRALEEVILHDPDPEVRAHAVNALHGTGAASDPLALYRRALEDLDGDVVTAGIDGIANLGTSAAAEVLLNLVNDEPALAAEAAAALEQLGGAVFERNEAMLREVQEAADEQEDLDDEALLDVFE